MSTIRILAGMGLCTLVSACSPSKMHLIGEESGRNADIQITDKTGVAAWNWGPQQFSQKINVVANELMSGAAGGGKLTLKLQDGTALEFIGQSNILVCTAGCESAHMPMTWRMAQ